ncbi:MAG: PVC-type heme-binding CxxCH protein, partial [Planctomycetota bacterium]
DTVKPRRSGSASNHQGRFWIGGYEPDRSDRAQGELRSANFRVTHPYASFLVGGGRTDATRVELVQSEGDRVFFKASGGNRENMYARYVDLSELQGESIYIKLVDAESGGWGHINFDDFRFHDADPRIQAKVEAATDREEGFLPLEAAARMTVPEGFEVELVAGEPDLHQPIAFCIDDQGRIWVAEAHSYPVRRPDDEGRDRILVFDDADGDGDWGAPTVFADDLNLVSGIEVGFGGVWVGAAPYLMFIPDRDGDLQPDGEPEILLDGWGYQDTHETLNAFNWGPDGWLYGCHGVFTHSRVGKPGTPDADREPINAGVWRYHPTRHEFEVFAWGSSNPWGVDFDEYGQAVITACVIPHLFHVIQGARYHRQAGQHFNPYVFDDIKTIADHLHYLGATPHSGNDVSDSVGGGHAHCGAMIYLGDAFPAEYRGGVFMSNIHGNRFNVDHLSRRGSGLVGTHGKDFLLANDPWFRGINMRTGPDGNVYLIDWYDEQACHLRTPEIWDRSNGRLYKVSYEGAERSPPVGLASMRAEELVDLQTHTNEWQARVARRVLQERGPDPQVHSALMELMERSDDPRQELRAVWALHATGGLSEPLALALMDHPNEYLRAWAIQLSLEDRAADEMNLRKMVDLSLADPSPVVRLYLASALQRLPHEQRWDIAAGLVAHGEDVGDHNLPLMIWYGIEPLIPSNPGRALELAWVSKIPQVSRFILRRMASGEDASFEPLITALENSDSEIFKSMLLDEMLVALVREDSEPSMPAAWSKVSPGLLQDASYRDRAIALALFFGDSSVAPELRRRLQDENASREARREALENLLRFEDPELPAILHTLLDNPELRGAAVRGLASYEHPRTAELLIAGYETFDLDTRQAAVSTMSSRVVYAKALLQAIIDGKLPSTALDSASARRQIAGFEDRRVNRLMSQAWGHSRPTLEGKLAEIERLKELMSADFLAQADLSRGREITSRTCLICHTLFGSGTDIGPDITGSNRADLDYILGNIIDPNAEVGNQYKMTVVALKNGRYLSGVISDRTERSITIRNDTESAVVSLEDIAKKANGEPRPSPSCPWVSSLRWTTSRFATCSPTWRARSRCPCLPPRITSAVSSMGRAWQAGSPIRRTGACRTGNSSAKPAA